MIDYIIKNGWIINGKRQKPFHGDISIKDGNIEEMKEHIEIPADFPDEKILDAQDGYVTPGFIDIHRHGDWQALHHGDDELLNRQGLTTVVNGNCGLSVAPAGKKYTEEIYSFLVSVTGKMDGNPLSVMNSMENYLDALSKISRSVNTGMLTGNGTIRASVKGYDSGKLSDEELHQVWNTLEESLAAGALGVSLGVAYAPEFEYDRDGLVEALQPLKGTDIPITTHIRNEGDGILLALQEVISVAEELQIPLHVSHMKCIGRKNWGDTPRKILKMLDEAGERGLKVDFDLYPYLTGSTQLVHLLPPEFQEGGTDAICKRLQDPVCRKALTETLKQPSDIFENIVELAGFERIYASTLHTDQYRPYAGKSIAEISGNLGRDPYETLYDILLAERCEVTMLDTIASEDDMLYFLKDDRANLISDAQALRYFVWNDAIGKSNVNYFGIFSLTFNGNVFLLFYSRFCFFLRHEQFQDTMLELALDILFGNIIANIEASLAGTGVTLTTDVFTGLFVLVIFIKTFSCTDGQITIVQFNLHFIFLESRQIHLQIIAIFFLLDISLHQICCTMSIQFLLSLTLCSVIIEWKIKKVIK